MRINVYTEELLPVDQEQPPAFEIVTAEYISSRTGEKMINWGVRIFLKSAPELHYIPKRDDDRSAITFWMGANHNDCHRFTEALTHFVGYEIGKVWREMTEKRQKEAEVLLNRGDF